MHVITYKRIKEFILKHPQSSVALGHWYKKMKRSTPESVNDVKRIFNNTDYIGNDRFVFNICGNKYRLIAVIFISTQIILIRFIGTHEEYDRIDCRKI
jgi:mRNA interferase HigB